MDPRGSLGDQPPGAGLPGHLKNVPQSAAAGPMVYRGPMRGDFVLAGQQQPDENDDEHEEGGPPDPKRQRFVPPNSAEYVWGVMQQQPPGRYEQAPPSYKPSGPVATGMMPPRAKGPAVMPQQPYGGYGAGGDDASGRRPRDLPPPGARRKGEKNAKSHRPAEEVEWLRGYDEEGRVIDEATSSLRRYGDSYARGLRPKEATAAAVLQEGMRASPPWQTSIAANGYGRLERTTSLPNLGAYRAYDRACHLPYAPSRGPFGGGDYGPTRREQPGVARPPPSTCGWGQPPQGVDRPYALDAQQQNSPASAAASAQAAEMRETTTRRPPRGVGPIALDEAGDEHLEAEAGGLVGRPPSIDQYLPQTGLTPSSSAHHFGPSPTASELARDFFGAPVSPNSVYSMPSFNFDGPDDRTPASAYSFAAATGGRRPPRPTPPRHPQQQQPPLGLARPPSPQQPSDQSAAPAPQDYAGGPDHQQLYAAYHAPTYYAPQQQQPPPFPRYHHQQQPEPAPQHSRPSSSKQRAKVSRRRPSNKQQQRRHAADEAAEAAEAATAAAATHVTFAPDVSQPPPSGHHHKKQALHRNHSEDESSLLRRSISLSSDDWARSGLDDTAEVITTLATFGRAQTVHGEAAYAHPGQPHDAYQQGLDRDDIDTIFEAAAT